MNEKKIERAACDGPVHIERLPNNDIHFAVEHNGVTRFVTMSEFNARRVLGGLSVLLGLPLQTSAAKKIAMRR